MIADADFKFIGNWLDDDDDNKNNNNNNNGFIVESIKMALPLQFTIKLFTQYYIKNKT